MMNLTKMMMEQMEIKFDVEGYCKTNDVVTEIFCEFEIKAPVMPMFKVGKMGHYDGEEETKEYYDTYTDFKHGRIEMDAETGRTNVWILAFMTEDYGMFLSETEIKNYDCEELEKEIIRRWEEQRITSKIKDCGSMNSLLSTLMENKMKITKIGCGDCFSDEQSIVVMSNTQEEIKITFQVLDVDTDDMVESINIVKINDTIVNEGE